MLDLVLFRSGRASEDVRESQRRRGAELSLVNEVIVADTAWRKQAMVAATAKRAFASAKAEGHPRAGAEPRPLAGAGRPTIELAALSSAAASADAAEKEAHSELQWKLLQIGNLVHEETPVNHVVSSPLPSSAVRLRPCRKSSPTASFRRLLASGLAEEITGTCGKWRRSAEACRT